MLTFTKIKNFNFTTITNQVFNQLFKGTPTSEVAFLCSVNETIPTDLCPTKWSYVPSIKSNIVYTQVEKLQYRLFLLKHGYVTFSLDYLYGLVTIFGLIFIKKNKDSIIAGSASASKFSSGSSKPGKDASKAVARKTSTQKMVYNIPNKAAVEKNIQNYLDNENKLTVKFKKSQGSVKYNKKDIDNMIKLLDTLNKDPSNKISWNYLNHFKE
jgi:virulence-associated protein VapD